MLDRAPLRHGVALCVDHRWHCEAEADELGEGLEHAPAVARAHVELKQLCTGVSEVRHECEAKIRKRVRTWITVSEG